MREFIGRVPKQFLYGLLLGVAVAGYGAVGNSDYDEQVASAEFYCDMSSKGVWPQRPELNCPKPEHAPVQRLVSL